MSPQTNYAFIGDVHSQAYPLEQALEYCHKNNLTPILLGDLFDSQCEVSDAPTVYRLARRAEMELGAIILRSNHQFLIEQIARGNEVRLKKDFARTVREFQEQGICVKKVAEWLETFPYMVVFRSSDGTEYRVAHAEIPPTIKVPPYNDTWKFFNPTEEERQLLLWGASYSLTDKERFAWMRDKTREWVAVSGHYHKVVTTEKTLVLDAGCGGKTRSWYNKRDPQLLLYEVNTKNVKAFEVKQGKL